RSCRTLLADALSRRLVGHRPSRSGPPPRRSIRQCQPPSHRETMRTSSTEATLPALQGSSLLGFLASLGAFRTLAILPEASDVRMRWVSGGGSYCPVFQLPSPALPEVLVEKLHAALRVLAGHYVITVDKDLKIPRGV